jgi:hypothetical protein
MGQCKECKQPVSDKAKTCPHCGVDAPVSPDTSLLVRGTIGLGAVVALATCIGSGDKAAQQASVPSTSSARPAVSAAVPTADEQRKAALLVAECRAQRDQIAQRYAQALRSKQPAAAADAVRSCASTDTSYGAMLRNADFLDLRARAVNRSISRGERQIAIDRLRELFPDDAKLHTKFYVDARHAIEREEAAQKRKQGVRIGMSKQDVLDSSWGRPNKINRSTYSWGVKEQWVYDGGYLYFDDDELTGIQN